MGKRRRRHQPRSASKRPKLPKYWVEDFPELQIENSDISLYITRVNLSDAHHVKLQNSLNEKGSTETADPLIEQKTSAAAQVASTSSSSFENKKSDLDEQRCGANRDPSSKQTTDEAIGNVQNQSDESKETEEQDLDRNLSISVKRARYPPLVFHRDPNFRHKKNGDCGDGIVNPYPKTEVPDKYWAQRKRLFSRFSDGIQLDKESWYSVTPEVIANHIAQRVVSATNKEGMVVMDAFCGVGGNIIAFARRPEVSKVICVDTNMNRLEMAAHNCEVYEVPKDKVLFVHADACDVLKSYSADGTVKAGILDEPKNSSVLSGYHCCPVASLPRTLDAIFMSPPWGGVEYVNIGPRQYSLSNIQLNGDVDGEDLLRLASQAFHNGQDKNIAMFLPRNLNGLSFAQSAFRCGLRESIELEMNLIDSKFKAITAYFVGH